MVDIQSISDGLELGENGIWYGKEIENVSYPSEGNDSCFEIEENSFWFQHRNRCIVSIVKSYPPENNGPIFDIGGGNGFVSSGLMDSGLNVVLVEPGQIGAINAKKRGLSIVVCATTNTAKFKQNSLDAVGLFDVIEHIEDDFAFLRSIKGLMKEGGYLYATVPSYSFLWSNEDVYAGHFKRYTLNSISKVLTSVGFQIEFSSYIFRFLPLPIFLFRTLPYRLGFSKGPRKANNISRDHTVKSKGGITENIFNLLLTRELDNLKEKKPMLFGGSCIVVAKIP